LPQQQPTEVVIAPETIQRRVKELAREISRDLAGQEPVLLGVLKGCFIFLSDLARQITIPAQVDFVRLSSYGHGDTSSGRVEMTKAPELNLSGRPVVVVEDIVDTGLSLAWLKEHLLHYQPADIKICVLVDKAERRQIELNLDYVGFKVPKGFLVGYGLDFNESYRCLPGIYELRTH
jgi:hypoxanthine phosphoribosyltransferase